MSPALGGTGHPPRCEWCDERIVGLPDSALGSGWKHLSSNRERCVDGVRVATPGDPDQVVAMRLSSARAYARRRLSTRGAP